MNVRDTKYKFKFRNSAVPLLYFLCCIALLSCRENRPERKVDRAFYYWKSVFHLSATEVKKLDQLQVHTLYVKYFDVEWDPSAQAPVPVAPLRNSTGQLPPSIRVIPVIFITNACLEKLDTSGIRSLAEKMNQLLQSLHQQIFHSAYGEIQLDCDWTPKTRDVYFSLIQAFRKVTGARLSATIRLHQVKYISSAGIPPVDRGLLMCYNMGNLRNASTRNSIIDATEFKKYTSRLGDYPLPLDLALPLFSWKVLFRQNEYKGLLRELPDSVLRHSFLQLEENRYRVLKDTLLAGYSFFEDDIIRVEESRYETIMSVAAELNARLKNSTPRLSLYHWDSLLLSKYPDHELEAIYNSLR